MNWKMKEYSTEILIIGLIIVHFSLCVPFFIVSAEHYMQFCRILSIAGALFLFSCTGILITAIFCQSYINNRKRYHVSTSIKLFLFVMTIISISNYFFRPPLIIILQDYDFALNYSDIYLMLAADCIYCLAIIVYLIIQLFYVWFYLPKVGFFQEGSKKNSFIKGFFGLTLIVNFIQKWLFETLVSREDNCEELLKFNQSCPGVRHYHTNITWLTESEREAYYINKLFGPVAYSFTMELLVVYFVLLCYCKPIHETDSDQEQSSVQESADPNAETLDTQSLVSPETEVHSVHKIGINWKTCKYAIIILLMIASMLASILCLFFKLVMMFSDNENPYEAWKSVYHICKASAIFIAIPLFCIFNCIYSDVQPLKTNNEQRAGEGRIKQILKKICCYTSSLPFSLCHKTDEPDLIVLKLTYGVSCVLLLTNCILQSLGLFFGELTDYDRLWHTILPNFLSIFGYALNYDILQRFLLTDSETFKKLTKDNFAKFGIVPFQIIRSFIRGATRFIQVLDPEVAFVAHGFLDQAIAFVDSLYPFSILIHITTALCWAEVIERFFEENAYEFKFVQQNDAAEQRQQDEELLLDETIRVRALTSEQLFL